MIIAKTLLGMEKVAAARIKELDPNAKVQASPRGFAGLVLVESPNEDELLRLINENVVENAYFDNANIMAFIIHSCTPMEPPMVYQYLIHFTY